jgi:hypothetical protein
VIVCFPVSNQHISIGIIDDVASANEALMDVLVTEINKNSRLVMATLDIFNVIPLFNLIIIYVLCSKMLARSFVVYEVDKGHIRRIS